MGDLISNRLNGPQVHITNSVVGIFSGNDCVAICMRDPRCEGGDYNLDWSFCYIHYHRSNCYRPFLRFAKRVYHFKKRPCGKTMIAISIGF